ncbi:MFS transporter (plasmid) [Mesorhizobium sp. AR07]|uniref:MFS transporter n=1 Tax=Mesorhizobium sp. AR07 TaxID=2865838 RepID=UPI00215DE83C|nr:MFS transporter [Mesorhizobium sp. AR07]UVK49503.1 MFS transporter [Mesorhizobium sp. AR07]
MLFRREWPVYPRTRCLSQSVLPIYAMLFAMQCARSMYIVLVAWFALQITGEIASVGKVLICWQLLAFTIGPFIGPLIDRSRRRTMFVIGETIHGTGVGSLAFIAWANSPAHTPISVLYATACVISVGSLLSYPSSQALIQRAGARLLMRTVSLGIFSSQIGNIVGAAVGGFCLTVLGVLASLAICAASSFLAAMFASFLDDEGRIRPTRPNPHMHDLIAGLLATVRNPRLKVAGYALLLAYASAHASNAFLAGFARYELKLPSNHYGWLAAMYSGGGLIGSVTFAGFSGVARERLLIGAGTVLLACATAAFSTSQTMVQAVLWQGLIGLSFVMVRAGSDVTILKTVSGRMVGRVRTNVDAGIGVIAVLIYIIPTLVPGIHARNIFLGLACLFGCGSCAILWMQWSGAKAARPQCHDGHVNPDHPSNGRAV